MEEETRLPGVLGQEEALAILRRSIESGRVASSWLFIGPPGVGKRGAALRFAAALNCARRGSEPCGECPSCRAVARGVHPDVRVWEREKDKKQIPIEMVREISASLSLKKWQGAWTVAVLDEADSLNWAAANAFLLTLEEPPPGTVIILTASNPQLMPETVVSRCRKLWFQPLPYEVVAGLLGARGEAGPEEARVAALMSEGSLGAAAEFLTEEWRGVWEAGLDLLGEIAERGEETVLHRTVCAATTRDAAERLLAVLEKALRLALRVRLGLPGADPGGGADGRLGALASRLDLSGFLRSLEAVAEASRMLRGNVNPRLAVEGLVIELAAVLGKPAGEGAGRGREAGGD